MAIKAVVITISDSCTKTAGKDTSGPALCKKLDEWDPSVTVERYCIIDEVDVIRSLVESSCKDVDLIITTGGTGLALRDVTVEAVKPILEKEATGIMTALVSVSLKHTQFAMLSNPLAGFRYGCFIVCMPGSMKAVSEYFEILSPILHHVLDLSKDSKKAIKECHIKLSMEENMDIPKNNILEHVCPHKTNSNSNSTRQPGVAFRPRKSEWPLMGIDEALQLIVSHSKDKCNLIKRLIAFNDTSAHNHILSDTILAKEKVPNYPASIKDGYAVISSDGPGVYNVVAISQTGDKDPTPLSNGTVARVTTGAPVPCGADAVVQVEDTELVSHKDGEEVSIRVLSTVKAGTDIRPEGSDISVGDLLLQKGTLINAAEIGLLASQGYCEVPVNGKPHVLILSTGNELVSHNEPKVKFGQVRDSNSQALMYLLKEDGYPVHYGGYIRDDMNQTVERLEQAAKECDIIISTGGVSMGETDHLKAAISQIGGTIHFGRVFMKPGKPTTFATLPNNKLFFGLPGNPVSAMVTYKLFVLPALRAWEGRLWEPTTFSVKLYTDRTLDPRPEYVRAVYQNGTVTMTGSQCSSRLLSMRSANILLKLPPKTDERTTLKKGFEVNAIVIGTL